MARIATKIANVEHDLGSANQVIGEEIQDTLRPPRTRAGARPKGVDPNEVINAALAGGMELNARLTQLEQGFDASRSRDAPRAGEPAPGGRHRTADQPSVPAHAEPRVRPGHRRRGVRRCRP